MGLNYYASSPTLVLPPQHPPHYLTHQSHSEVAMTDGCTTPPATTHRFIAKIHTPPSLNYLAKSCHSTAGRKRSRADIGEDFDDHLTQSAAQTLHPITEPSSGPEHEHSRSMDDPDLHESSLNESGALNKDTDGTERPQLVARKSQRRVSDAVDTSQTMDVEVDPIVRRLGIGWKRILDLSCPATAGQQAFIRNQFAFHEPKVVLQHGRLGILVVQTKPASAQGYWDQWWLFTDDLRSCRFLCHDEADLFRRLDNKRQDERGNWQPDILVEGPVVHAKDAMLVAESLERPAAVESNGVNGASTESSAQTKVDVEMRM